MSFPDEDFDYDEPDDENYEDQVNYRPFIEVEEEDVFILDEYEYDSSDEETVSYEDFPF